MNPLATSWLGSSRSSPLPSTHGATTCFPSPQSTITKVGRQMPLDVHLPRAPTSLTGHASAAATVHCSLPQALAWSAPASAESNNGTPCCTSCCTSSPDRPLDTHSLACMQPPPSALAPLKRHRTTAGSSPPVHPMLPSLALPIRSTASAPQQLLPGHRQRLSNARAVSARADTCPASPLHASYLANLAAVSTRLRAGAAPAAHVTPGTPWPWLSLDRPSRPPARPSADSNCLPGPLLQLPDKDEDEHDVFARSRKRGLDTCDLAALADVSRWAPLSDGLV